MSKIRVRFAPSPTGIMHLGNVRAALLNYLFAKQKNGDFILRIEDTDNQRNLEHATQQIFKDLEWLNLNYNEGPYYQSKNTDKYQEKLEELINKNLVYKCFCTPDILAQKKERQIALKLAPRYDRACLKLKNEEIKAKLESKTDYIWRFKVPEGKISFFDLAKGQMNFDLVNFADFALTRSDHSFTFIFANCVDDIDMQMSHVFRGEDHLSNTVVQILLYQAFNSPIPIFWHLPIICNLDGSKLSKRDFGFSLEELKDAGFLPQAIVNYLALIGNSFKEEILSLDEIVKAFDFAHIQSSSTVKYDEQKLRWVNQQWIQKLDLNILVKMLKPVIEKQFANVVDNSTQWWNAVAEIVKTNIHTLNEAPEKIAYLFQKPNLKFEKIEGSVKITGLEILILPLDEYQKIRDALNHKSMTELDLIIEKHQLHKKYLYQIIRIIITGKTHGAQVNLLAKIYDEHFNLPDLQTNLAAN
jgi:nondiscriminating glutamyl-tRNA synthetase